ncbi:MAG TPA: hypothetical protein VD865_17195 [Stenotrophomonas sp.]|nr:hypothetical protein [Stenotrophomonas sp.]
MKTSSLAAGIAILVAAAGWHFYSSTKSEGFASGGPAAADGTRSEQATAGSQPKELTSTVPGSIGTRAPLSGVTTYGELTQRLAGNRIDEGQRLQYLLTAAQVCEGFEREAANKSISESTTHYNNYVRRFCSNFSGNSQELEAELLAHSGSDVVQARELSVMASDGLSRSAELTGETIVLTSDNPDAVYNAAAALASRHGWELGQNVATSPQQKAALPAAQWIAAQMLACDLSGGCEANGLTTAIECASYSLCEPGVTVRSLLQRTSTPTEFELATRVYEQLMRDRNLATKLRS